MKISSRARYAVTAMLDVALVPEGGYITLNEISDNQGISLSYLEQIFAKLRQHKLVQSNRGPRGGYQLALKPRNINVFQIIAAVDKDVDVRKCKGKKDCHHGECCSSHDLWDAFSEKVADFLQTISLQDLIESESAKASIKH